MRITSNDLTRQLAKGLAPLYVIHGEALLLSIEAADAVRSSARDADFCEREVLVAEQGFKWSLLRNSAQSMSLFSSRKLIDLRIPSGKPGVEGAQALQDHCDNLNHDTITLISLPKLDSSALKSKWFSALDSHGVVIQTDDISLHALPAWIGARMARQQQSADADTLAFLAQRVEGNLLAAYQEIQKLSLLYPAGALSFEQVHDAVMDVARYDVSKLSEAMLVGDIARFARILDGLRAEGTAPPQILWVLAEDIRSVARVTHIIQHSSNLASALREARVWSTRKDAIGQAARRFSGTLAERALRQLFLIDKLVKGLRKGDVWDELLQFGIRCAQARTA